MYSVLIVDDEANIREGLMKIIPWEDYGFELCGEADNGQQALQMIEKHRPTIVLTDIRMPEMNGIELLQNIQKKSPKTKTVVISGYDDFTYVRNAMRYGAINYLLKPIDKDELTNTIIETVDLIESDAVDLMRKHETLELMKTNTLNRIINDQISIKELREKQELLSLDLHCDQMCIAIVKTDFSADEENKMLRLFEIQNICYETVTRSYACHAFQDHYNNIVIIFYIKSGELNMDTIQCSLNETVQNIQFFLNERVTIYCSTPIDSHRLLPDSYKQALKGIDYASLWGTNLVFSHNPAESQISFTEIDFTTISELIRKGEKEKLKEYIEPPFKKILNKEVFVAPYIVKYHVVDIISTAVSTAQVANVSAETLKRLKETAYTKMQFTDRIDEIYQFLLFTLNNIIDEVDSRKEKPYSFIVQRVIAYIDTQYADSNISLKTLADRLSVNPAYMGRLFKNETGEYFSDYLNRIRVIKAERMLNDTNHKAKDIGSLVGFSTTSYFYTIFKKITGHTPGDARQ